MRRLREESGFTLLEILIVVVIVAVLVAVAIPTFMSFSGPSQTAGAKANVRSAIPVAEKMAGTNGNYAGMSGATLRTAAPGIGPNVKAVAVSSNQGYCIQDTENSGTTYYNYVGGTPGAALQAGYSQGTVQAGTCLAAVGTAAS